MNAEAIDRILSKNPKLKKSRHILEKMQPGTFCIHRSWGFGEIKNYDEANNRLIIEFVEEGKSEHPMDPAFCVGKVTLLDDAHVLVRYRKEPEVVEGWIKNEPVELVIEILSVAPEGTALSSEIERTLNIIMGEAKAKKWWAATRKALVKDPRVAVPVKKHEPYVLRDEPLSPEEEILEEFYINKQPKKKILLAEKLYQLSDSVEQIASDLPQVLEELTTALKEARQLTQSDCLHGVWVRNDLARHLCEDVDQLEPTSKSIIEATSDLSELAQELPSQYYGRLLDLLSRLYPEGWVDKVIDLLRNSSGKMTTECVNFLIEQECGDLVSENFQKWLSEKSFKSDLLYWIIKNRHTRRYHKFTDPLMGEQLLAVIFYAIDTEALQQTGNRRIMLAELVSEDRELIADLLQGSSYEIAKDLARTLMMSQGFEVLTKKSVLARFIKQFPKIQSLVAGEEQELESEQLMVSKASMDARKEEYEELINVKLPENKEAIAVAREHGDLKENSEYKMARQDQETLLARKGQLEADLNRARVTDFKEATNEQIGIGSVVTVEDLSKGKETTYAILGAWDSDPENNVLSYQTPLAQSLIKKTVGEEVTTEIGGTSHAWKIKSISRWVDNKMAAKA